MIYLNSVYAVFLGVLIFLGAVYISVYEKAPVWERIQVSAVAMGIFIGLILANS